MFRLYQILYLLCIVNFSICCSKYSCYRCKRDLELIIHDYKGYLSCVQVSKEQGILSLGYVGAKQISCDEGCATHLNYFMDILDYLKPTIQNDIHNVTIERGCKGAVLEETCNEKFEMGTIVKCVFPCVYEHCNGLDIKTLIEESYDSGILYEKCSKCQVNDDSCIKSDIVEKSVMCNGGYCYSIALVGPSTPMSMGSLKRLIRGCISYPFVDILNSNRSDGWVEGYTGMVGVFDVGRLFKRTPTEDDPLFRFYNFCKHDKTEKLPCNYKVSLTRKIDYNTIIKKVAVEKSIMCMYCIYKGDNFKSNCITGDVREYGFDQVLCSDVCTTYKYYIPNALLVLRSCSLISQPPFGGYNSYLEDTRTVLDKVLDNNKANKTWECNSENNEICFERCYSSMCNNKRLYYYSAKKKRAVEEEVNVSSNHSNSPKRRARLLKHLNAEMPCWMNMSNVRNCTNQTWYPSKEMEVELELGKSVTQFSTGKIALLLILCCAVVTVPYMILKYCNKKNREMENENKSVSYVDVSQIDLPIYESEGIGRSSIIIP